MYFLFFLRLQFYIKLSVLPFLCVCVCVCFLSFNEMVCSDLNSFKPLHRQKRLFDTFSTFYVF